ncbi:MAG: type II secretion system protein GspG [Myxococcaceae bacterium]
MTKRTRSRRGLSLIEIIVVITIISMLTTAVAVYAIGQHRQSQRRTAWLDTKTASTAFDLYRASVGHYPDQREGWEPLIKQRALKEAPVDPWGTVLHWELRDGDPVVISLGADAAPGGEGDDADILSTQRP